MQINKVLVILASFILTDKVLSENNLKLPDSEGMPSIARRYLAFEPDMIEKVLLLLERKDIQEYIAITDKQLSSIKDFENEKLPENCQVELTKIREKYQESLKGGSNISKKEAWDDFDLKMRTLFQRCFFKRAKEILDAEQYKHLLSIIIQVYGPEMLICLQKEIPIIEKLSLTEDQKKNILRVTETFHVKKLPLMKFIGRHTISEWARGDSKGVEKKELENNIIQLISLSKDCDQNIWKCLSQEQKNILNQFIGQRIKIKWESI